MHPFVFHEEVFSAETFAARVADVRLVTGVGSFVKL